MELSTIVAVMLMLSGGVLGAPDNRGTEFIVGFMQNYDTQMDVQIFVTTSRTSVVDVQITIPRYSRVPLDETFTVTAGEVKKIAISNDIRGSGTELSTKSIYITASDEVVVYGVNSEAYSNDAFLGFPLDVIGKEYYTVSHFPSEQPCEFMIFGTEDRTTVTITYADNSGVSVSYDGTTYGRGSTQTIIINRFDTYQAQTYGDLTGTHITADKNFVLMSGNQLTNINPHSYDGSGGTRDTLVDQMMPVNTWGTEFGFVATPDRTTGDEIKFVGSEDGTSIRLECTDGTGVTLTTNAGSHVQYITPSNVVCHVKSTKPIMVILFVVSMLTSSEPSDPALITILPFEQFAADYTFSTPQYYAGSYINYFMFMIEKAEIDGLRFNDQPLSSPVYKDIPNTGFVGGYISIPEGTHTVRHTKRNSNFGGFIFGRAYAESYGMPTGLRMAPINDPCTPTSSVLGDGIDNDCDGRIDEELCEIVSNVAKGKPSRQSSLYLGRTDWDADKGNDGNSDGNIYNQHCFHTAHEYEPWWEVDLEGIYILERADVYNRLDCCISRAAQVEIATGTTSGSLSRTAYYSGGIGNSYSFDLGDVSARYVRLTLKGKTEYLQLCEIEVYGHGDDDADGVMDEDCAMPAPVHGNWGDWGAWSNFCYCTGLRPRERSCDNPAPQYDGNQCDGSGIENANCQISSTCTVDGELTQWSAWGSCSVTCGAGTAQRTRSCDPAPANGGKDCVGALSDTQSCYAATTCPDCASNPCVNADSCTDGSTDYTCNCRTGWTGQNCDQDDDECASNNPPCANGGSCTNTRGGYSCTCNSAWQGTNCDQDVNECAASPSPCKNGATCSNSAGGYSCQCTTGWSGTNCDTDINECTSASPPCANGATCSNSQGDYTCTCNSAWQGKNCDQDVDECAASPSPCKNGATCSNSVGGYSCQCTTGWSGTNCDTDINECTSASPPCANGATCTNTQGDYTCTCDSAWQGKDCDQDVDECSWSTTPCQNGGACTNSVGGYSCQCTVSWIGTNCDIDVDECASNSPPCQNGASCTNTQGDYTCTCDSAWQGKDCDQDVDECSSANPPCQNGATCTNSVGGYSCQCATGWNGTNCDIDINECTSSSPPCQNGGTCANSQGDYSCTCNSAWQGKDCDQDVDECSSASPPCQNGATCINSVGGYSCQCATGWNGTNCDIDINECTSSSPPCQNGGICANSQGDYSCTCNSAWQGKDCDQDVDECSSAAPPCQNGATCINSVGGYSCLCAIGWNGTNCDTDIDECASNSPPCANGATCTNTQGDYTCTCTTGWQSKDCDVDINECDASPCVNGACINGPGVYSCDCDGGWTGTHCDEDIDECLSDPCTNGATCDNLLDDYYCNCTGGWQGKDCDIDINECDSSPCVHGTCNNLPNAYSCTCNPDYTARNCDYKIGTPMDGSWGAWGKWRGCSATCGTGTQKRYRECDDPSPDYGGLPCPGDSYESRSCTATATCPPQVDGNWGPWSTFSACSKTCGEGSQSKFRLCNSPAPSNGGAGCSGDQVVVSTCNDQDCDDNDSYGAAYVNRCPSGFFTCQSGGITCIQDTFVCDCYEECEDGSDELIPWAGDACNQVCENAAPGLVMSFYVMLMLLLVAMRLL